MKHLASLHRVQRNRKNVTYLKEDQWQASIDTLINEYNLICEKKSQLPRKMRERVFESVSHLIDKNIINFIDEKKAKAIKEYERKKPYILKWQQKNKDTLNAKRRERAKNKYPKLIQEIKEEIIKADIGRSEEETIPLILFVFMYKTGLRGVAALSKHTGYEQSYISSVISRWRENGIMSDNNLVLEIPEYSELGLIIQASLISLVGDGKAVSKIDIDQKFMFAIDKGALEEKKRSYELIKDADLSIRLKHCIAAYFQIELGTLYRYTVKEFESIKETRFLKVQNAGARSLNELKYYMKTHNLKLQP